MTDSRTLIKEHLIPGLRERGFKGSLPHFRRMTDAGVHLLTFQLDKWGSGDFIVEIAKAPLGPVCVPWGDPVPSSKLTAYDIATRLRLGAGDAGSDHWFKQTDLAADPAGFSLGFFELVETQGNRWWDDP